jgi:hypothetical protein
MAYRGIDSGMPDTPLAFVIMPFDEAFQSIYEDLIRPPLEEAGFTVRRADSLVGQRSILQDIVSDVVSAELIVADLTGLNANVMYELGLAHGLGKRTVVLMQNSLDGLPFDLRVYRANVYSTHYRDVARLHDLLRSVGRAALDRSEQFSNPVIDFSPGSLTVRSASALTTSESRHNADEREGYVEAAVRLSDLASRLNASSENIVSLVNKVSEKAQRNTSRIQRATANLGDRAAGAILAVINDTAADLDAFATDLEPEAANLESMLSEFGVHADAIAAQLQVSSPSDIQSAGEIITMLRSVESTFGTTGHQVNAFVVSLVEIPNASENLTRKARRAAAVTKRIVDALINAEVESARIRGILESRLPAL